ncbi:MAG TPA: hypothetical protein VK151_14615 [Fluviicola sp.]|nr:hypothetical protein [Fluviicola sp.]
MSEEEEKKVNFREEFEAHLNSPLPILIRIRNFIFGKESPDTYTKFSFFLALSIWLIFLTWSVLGSIAIRMREMIVDQKEINVTEMIEARGIELGFEPNAFIGRLEAFHALSIGFWIVVFIGLVLLWRKNERFVYFFFTGCGLYLLFMWVMLGFGYYRGDTTFFDKIVFWIMVLHTAVYAYFLKREKTGERLNFFGVDEDETT